MKASRARVALRALSLAWALPAAGQNQILNSDFDVDVSNWTPNVSATVVTHDGDSGIGLPLGAASLEFPGTAANSAHMSSNCVLVGPGIKVAFGGLGRLHVDLGGGDIDMTLRFFSTTNCSFAGALGFHRATPVSQASGTVDGATGLAFTRFEGETVESPGAAQSMRLSANITAGGGSGVYRVVWDRMYLGPSGTTPVALGTFTLE